MTRRRWVLVGAALALAIAVAAIVWPRDRDDTTTTPAPRRAGGSVRLGEGTAAARPASSTGGRNLPPPPADFDPGSAPTNTPGVDPRVVEQLARGELPVTPPGFTDDAERARFRTWWLAEGARRADVYRQRFPSDTLPNEDETRALLEEMYDAGEPPRPGEDAQDVDERHQRWFERWQDFTAAYGEPPMGVFSYGGDPAFGTGEPPPVVTSGPALVPDTSRPTAEDDPDAPRAPMQPAGPR